MTRQRILIAENDSELRPILALHLRNEEYEVSCAGDVSQALSAARRESPDLMLLDVDLRGDEGEDVRECVAHAEQAMIPLICLADAHLSRRATAVLAEEVVHASAVIQKPVATSELLAMVRAALERRSTSAV